jgi:hypothetical protein
MWRLGDGKVAFRGSIPERDNLVILNQGLAKIAE